MITKAQINALKRGDHNESNVLELKYNKGDVKLGVMLAFDSTMHSPKMMLSKDGMTTITSISFDHLEAFRKKEGRTHLFMKETYQLLDRIGKEELITNE